MRKMKIRSKLILAATVLQDLQGLVLLLDLFSPKKSIKSHYDTSEQCQKPNIPYNIMVG